MKNIIEIKYEGMYKAIWRWERKEFINHQWCIRERCRFIFIEDTIVQAERRAHDFRTGTGEFTIPRPEITEVIYEEVSV